jgi:hypothetical protein
MEREEEGLSSPDGGARTLIRVKPSAACTKAAAARTGASA